jgi:hypothetical protein
MALPRDEVVCAGGLARISVLRGHLLGRGAGAGRHGRRAAQNPSAPRKRSSRRHQRRWMSNPSRKTKKFASGSKPCWTPPTGSPTRGSGSRKAWSFSAVRWSPMSLENGLGISHAIRRTSSPLPTGLRCPNRRRGISARRRAVSLHSGATSSARCRSCFSDCSSWHCRWGPLCWRHEAFEHYSAKGFGRNSCRM